MEWLYCFLLKNFFKTGSVVLKSGSENIFVYTIKGISIMSEKVIL
jgi:hypothetical protein